MESNREKTIENLKQHVDLLKNQISRYLDQISPYGVSNESDPNSRNDQEVNMFLRRVKEAKLMLAEKETGLFQQKEEEAKTNEQKQQALNSRLKKMIEREKRKHKEIEKMFKSMQKFNEQSEREILGLKKEIEHASKMARERNMTSPKQGGILNRFSKKKDSSFGDYLDPFLAPTPITNPPVSMKRKELSPKPIPKPIPKFVFPEAKPSRKFTGRFINTSEVNSQDRGTPHKSTIMTEKSAGDKMMMERREKGRNDERGKLNKFRSINRFKKRLDLDKPVFVAPVNNFSRGNENEKAKRMILSGEIQEDNVEYGGLFDELIM